MARRKSTIGHDPLKATKPAEPPPAAPRPATRPAARPASQATAAPSAAAQAARRTAEPAKEQPKAAPEPTPAPTPTSGPKPAPEAAAARASSRPEKGPEKPAAAGQASTAPKSEREAKALSIVQFYYGWSAAAGLLPLPWVDVAAVIGLQVKMLEELARLYKVPFDGGMLRPLIVALISGGGSHLLTAPAVSTLKVIPVVGPLLALLSLPAIASASCWATGRVFIMHFESGGTLLDFDPEKARAHYAKHMQEKA